MSNNLPSIWRSNAPAVPNNRAVRKRSRAEMEVYDHQLRMAVDVEKDIIDTDALTDVITVATEAELAFLREFRAKADGSPAAAELVARKLQILADINNRRIARRFGR